MAEPSYGDYAGEIYQLWSPMINNAVDADAVLHGLAIADPGVAWYHADTSTWIDNMGYTFTPSSGKIYEGSLNGWEPKASVLHWSEKIPALWRNWDMLPDPSHLGTPSTNLLGAVYATIGQLAMDPQAKAYDVKAGDPEFASQVTHLQGAVTSFNGEAMITFSHEISSRIGYTAQLQAQVAAVLAFAIQAEQRVWAKAREEVVEIARQAVTAFEHGYPGGGGSGISSETLGLVSAIAGALSLVPTGPGSAFFAGIATAAGSLSTFKAAAGEEAQSTPLDADSPQAVCDNIVKALENLDKAIAQAEGVISKGCTDLVGTLQAQVTTYGLVEAELVTEDDPRDILAIDVELDKLRDLANNTLPAIAEGFHRAQNLLSGAPVPGPWERPAGFGENPYPAYSGLVDELDSLISRVRTTLEDSAEKMAAVAKDFGGTDNAVANDFNQRTTALGA